MWSITAYILCKISRGRGGEPVRFSEIDRIVFDVLWREHKIVFHDDRRELFNDLRYMAKLGAVEIVGGDDMDRAEIVIRDREFFRKIEKEYDSYIHNDNLRERFPLISKAIEIINDTISSYLAQRDSERSQRAESIEHRTYFRDL